MWDRAINLCYVMNRKNIIHLVCVMYMLMVRFGMEIQELPHYFLIRATIQKVKCPEKICIAV